MRRAVAVLGALVLATDVGGGDRARARQRRPPRPVRRCRRASPWSTPQRDRRRTTSPTTAGSPTAGCSPAARTAPSPTSRLVARPVSSERCRGSRSNGDHGMLGFAPANDYATTGRVYISYDEGDPNGTGFGMVEEWDASPAASADDVHEGADAGRRQRDDPGLRADHDQPRRRRGVGRAGRDAVRQRRRRQHEQRRAQLAPRAGRRPALRQDPAPQRRRRRRPDQPLLRCRGTAQLAQHGVRLRLPEPVPVQHRRAQRPAAARRRRLGPDRGGRHRRRGHERRLALLRGHPASRRFQEPAGVPRVVCRRHCHAAHRHLRARRLRRFGDRRRPLQRGELPDGVSTVRGSTATTRAA